ncbi:australin isoform a-related [Anaeramoeba flamelloides]|uniref:Australin isoform a-related n=1 Tax=Anaeramoeba flamelloides TaxID=1746091 RepID=A0AAV7ZQ55_9EUKA|nr:australin isoform a-related [Anaeramoeba flamelloides]
MNRNIDLISEKDHFNPLLDPLKPKITIEEFDDEVQSRCKMIRLHSENLKNVVKDAIHSELNKLSLSVKMMKVGELLDKYQGKLYLPELENKSGLKNSSSQLVEGIGEKSNRVDRENEVEIELIDENKKKNEKQNKKKKIKKYQRKKKISSKENSILNLDNNSNLHKNEQQQQRVIAKLLACNKSKNFKTYNSRRVPFFKKNQKQNNHFTRKKTKKKNKNKTKMKKEQDKILQKHNSIKNQNEFSIKRPYDHDLKISDLIKSRVDHFRSQLTKQNEKKKIKKN